jgi:hydrogenase 3 maturation protease
MSLLERLNSFLGDPRSRKVAILGVGSPIRGDDAVGLIVVDELEKRGLKDILLIRAEASPELFLGTLEEYGPTHVIIVDAAGLGIDPGEARVVSAGEVLGATISTHTLPLTILIGYLEGSMNVKTMLIGIQPKDMDFSMEASEEVRSGAERVAQDIYNALTKGR